MLCGQWTSGKLDAQLRIGTEILNIVGDAGSDLIFANGTKRDLSHWSVYLRGPSQGAKGTPEESGWFALDIPVEYKPPKLRTAERCAIQSSLQRHFCELGWLGCMPCQSQLSGRHWHHVFAVRYKAAQKGAKPGMSRYVLPAMLLAPPDFRDGHKNQGVQSCI